MSWESGLCGSGVREGGAVGVRKRFESAAPGIVMAVVIIVEDVGDPVLGQGAEHVGDGRGQRGQDDGERPNHQRGQHQQTVVDNIDLPGQGRVVDAARDRKGGQDERRHGEGDGGDGPVHGEPHVHQHSRRHAADFEQAEQADSGQGQGGNGAARSDQGRRNPEHAGAEPGRHHRALVAGDASKRDNEQRDGGGRERRGERGGPPFPPAPARDDGDHTAGTLLLRCDNGAGEGRCRAVRMWTHSAIITLSWQRGECGRGQTVLAARAAVQIDQRAR